MKYSSSVFAAVVFCSLLTMVGQSANAQATLVLDIHRSALAEHREEFLKGLREGLTRFFDYALVNRTVSYEVVEDMLSQSRSDAQSLGIRWAGVCLTEEAILVVRQKGFADSSRIDDLPENERTTVWNAVIGESHDACRAGINAMEAGNLPAP